MRLRLGKLPARIDARTLRLGAYLRAELPPIPTSIDWQNKVPTFPLYRNDEIGCCAIAGSAHLQQVWTANDSATVETPTEDQVLAEYQAVSGWDGVPGSPSDVGCIMLDVLRHWRSRGMFGRRIAAYASVDPHNLDEVRRGIQLFGGVLLGVQLPLKVQGQPNSERWLAPNPAPVFGPWSKGSWGGHLIAVCGYDPDRLVAITWGGLKLMSWNFFSQYVDECYVALSSQWVGPDSIAPNGFDALQLARDLGAIG